MRNPLRSEAEAYRLLLVVIGGAAVIIVAAYGSKWAGVAAAVLAFGALGWWLMREPVPGASDSPRPLASATPVPHHGPPTTLAITIAAAAPTVTSRNR